MGAGRLDQVLRDTPNELGVSPRGGGALSDERRLRRSSPLLDGHVPLVCLLQPMLWPHCGTREP